MTAHAGDTLLLKAQLRQRLRRLRAAIAAPERQRAALAAARHLATLPALRHARRVAVYLEAGSEIGTAPLLDWLWAQGIAVYLPRICADHRLQFHRHRAGDALRQNAHGIFEPLARSPRCTLAQLDLLVLPLTGFDRNGRRLGSGGGYYDRALATRRRRPWRVGYAYALQQVERLPSDPWDVRLHAVVTEHGVLQWPTG